MASEAETVIGPPGSRGRERQHALREREREPAQHHPFVRRTGNQKICFLKSVARRAKGFPLVGELGFAFDLVAVLPGVIKQRLTVDAQERRVDRAEVRALTGVGEADQGEHARAVALHAEIVGAFEVRFGVYARAGLERELIR